MYYSSNNNAFDAAINAQTRRLAISATLYTNNDEDTALDLTNHVSSVTTSSDIGRKLLLAGAVSCEMSVTLTRVDDDLKAQLRSYMQGGAIIVVKWAAKYGSEDVVTDYPGFIVQELNEDIVNDVVTLQCVDIVGALASVKLSSVSALANKNVADLIYWYYLKYNGTTVYFGEVGLGRFFSTALTDIAGADATIRDVIDRIALANGAIARATTRQNAFASVITFASVDTQTYTKTYVTPITRRTSGGDIVSTPAISVDIAAGSISCTLYRDDGSIYAEEIASGLPFLAQGGSDYASWITNRISRAYTTYTAAERCYMTHRGNPRMQAGDYALDYAQSADTGSLCTSVTHTYSGGLDGTSARDYDGYEEAGNGNIGDVISQGNSITDSLAAQLAEVTTDLQAATARVEALEEDTDWQYCYVGEEWANVDGYPLRARRVGRTVMINGYLTPLSSWANNNYAYVAVVPEWARPSIAITALLPSNWSDRCTLFLGVDGIIVLYGHTRANGAATPVQNGEHIDIAITYVV